MTDNLLNTSGPVAEAGNVNPEVTNATPDLHQGESPAVTNDIKAAPQEFIDTLSEDLRPLSNLKDFKDVNQLAKSYVELQRMVGNSVRIPPADASEEAKQEFYSKIKDLEGVLIKGDEKFYDKLGRPESSEAYKLEELIKQDHYNNIPGIRDELNAFKNIAHEVGLTEEQAQKIVEFRAKALDGYESSLEQSRAAGEAKLRELWGQDYDNRLNAARKVVGLLGEKYGDSIDQLVNSEAGNNPALLHVLSELAGTYKEKNHIGMSGVEFGNTPEMAAQKIADKRADKGFMKAYMDDMHPGHKKAVADMQKLYSIVSGQ